MTKEEIEIRRLELDIEETKLYREETEAQIIFNERRVTIERERNDLDVKMMEVEVADLKEKL